MSASNERQTVERLERLTGDSWSIMASDDATKVVPTDGKSDNHTLPRITHRASSRIHADSPDPGRTRTLIPIGMRAICTTQQPLLSTAVGGLIKQIDDLGGITLDDEKGTVSFKLRLEGEQCRASCSATVPTTMAREVQFLYSQGVNTYSVTSTKGTTNLSLDLELVGHQGVIKEARSEVEARRDWDLVTGISRNPPNQITVTCDQSAPLMSLLLGTRSGDSAEGSSADRYQALLPNGLRRKIRYPWHIEDQLPGTKRKILVPCQVKMCAGVEGEAELRLKIGQLSVVECPAGSA